MALNNEELFAELCSEALRKGWKTPVSEAFGRESWIRYWLAMRDYEKNPDAGRPVAPHRSGR